MRNIKLLLATTAMLSVTAMGANAFDPINVSGDGANLDAYVQFVAPVQLRMSSALDFGIISNPSSGNYVKIDTATGEVTTDATRISDRAQRGALYLDYPDGYSWSAGTNPDRSTSTTLKLQLPTEIRLTKGSSGGLCGYVEEITATNDGIIQTAGGVLTNEFYVGGKFTVKAKTDETLSLNGGSCSGSGTVTAILIDGD